MKLQITFPDGTQDAIFLSDSEIRKLEYQVKKQNQYMKENGIQSTYALADELYVAIHMYTLGLDEVPDEERSEADEGKRDHVGTSERE